jgi:hypothetical protein
VSQIISRGDFEGANGQALGRQRFFDQLSVNDAVNATSDKQGLGRVLSRLTAGQVEFENDDGLVATLSSSSDDDSNDDKGENDDELSGLPSEVTENSFVLNGRIITVVGSTRSTNLLLKQPWVMK